MRLNLTIALLAAAVPLSGIVTVDDPANHVVNPGSPFDGVGALTSPLGNCSGTLLSSGMHILTAAHCVTMSGTTTPFAAGSIQVSLNLPGGSVSYTGGQVFVDPGYVPITLSNYTADLAIIALSQVVDSAAQRYGIYRASDELQIATMVGYGRRGTGDTGSIPGTSGSTKRMGVNRFEQTTPDGEFLLFDFDNGLVANDAFQNGDLGEGLNEVSTAQGDSGGPAFIFSGGSYLIAGITVFGDCPTPSSLDFDGSCSGGNPMVNSTFGEIAGATRVSFYQGFVDDILVPELSSCVYLGVGLALCALRRRIRK